MWNWKADDAVGVTTHHERLATGLVRPHQRIGEDVSEKLDYTPGVFEVERHIRGKWVCRSCERLIQRCSSASAIGKYRMIASAHPYELSLAADGAGTLSRDGMAEDIKWDWANGQVFLNLKGGLAVDLETLSAPPASTQARAVYLGLIPKCRSGRATELDLRLAEPEPHFARTD